MALRMMLRVGQRTLACRSLCAGGAATHVRAFSAGHVPQRAAQTADQLQPAEADGRKLEEASELRLRTTGACSMMGRKQVNEDRFVISSVGSVEVYGVFGECSGGGRRS
jgi:hypothetical protein